MKYNNAILVCPGCGGEATGSGYSESSSPINSVVTLLISCSTCGLKFSLRVNTDAFQMSVDKYRKESKSYGNKERRT